MDRTQRADCDSQKLLIGDITALVTVAAATYLLSIIQAAQSTQTGEYARPYGILYLLAVVLITSRWGGRVGSLALGLSLIACKCFLMAPRFSLLFASMPDLWECGTLLLVGTLMILAISEQRASRARTLDLLATVSVQQGELQAILDSMTDGVIIGDLDGNIQAMNPAALRLYGFASAQEVQRPLDEISALLEFHTLDWRPLPQQDRPFARALRGERFSNYVVHVRRVDTGKFWDGSYTGTLVQDERARPILVLVTVRDISEHEQIEEALQISEDRLRVAVEEAGIGTWHWDIRADHRQWSARCKALYGLSPDEDVTFDRFMQALHPDDRQRTQEAMAAALLDKSRYEIQHRAVWPDGAVHWVVSVGYGHYDSAGDPLYIEGIARPQEAIPQSGESFPDKGYLPVRLPD